MKPDNRLSHFAAQFPVHDVEKAMIWYRENLDFEILFEWGEPIDYAVLKRDDSVSIHLSRVDSSEEIHPRSIYIFCFNVNTVYETLKTKGVEGLGGICDQEYGMRDFDLYDPYGHRLSFGTGIHLLAEDQ